MLSPAEIPEGRCLLRCFVLLPLLTAPLRAGLGAVPAGIPPQKAPEVVGSPLPVLFRLMGNGREKAPCCRCRAPAAGAYASCIRASSALPFLPCSPPYTCWARAVLRSEDFLQGRLEHVSPRWSGCIGLSAGCSGKTCGGVFRTLLMKWVTAGGRRQGEPLSG